MHTMFLAVSADRPGSRFEELGTFAFILETPSGDRCVIVSSDEEPVRLREGRDGHYAAIMHCARIGLLPAGTHIHVVSKQQPYHGGKDYAGPLNVSREDRQAQGYTNKDGKTPINKWEHLREMDTLLGSMGITTSGRMPETPDDRATIKLCHEAAKAALARLDMLRDGVEPPEAY